MRGKLVNHGMQTHADIKRLLAKAEHCEKLGVINAPENLYLALFRREGSQRPCAVVPLEMVMDLLDQMEAQLPTDPEQP